MNDNFYNINFAMTGVGDKSYIIIKSNK